MSATPTTSLAAWPLPRLSCRCVSPSPRRRKYQFDTAFLKRLEGAFPHFDLQSLPIRPRPCATPTRVYTDVWASMGQEDEQQERVAALTPFQVNAELMAAAPGRAVFMHCLPARRGEEVTDEVIDSPQSIVVRQAANRMHLQKGLLAWLLMQQD